MKEVIKKSGYAIRDSSSGQYIGSNQINRWLADFSWVSKAELIFLWSTKRGPEDYIKRFQKRINSSRTRYLNNKHYYANNILHLDAVADKLIQLEIVNVDIEIVKECDIKILKSTPAMFIKSSFGDK